MKKIITNVICFVLLVLMVWEALATTTDFDRRDLVISDDRVPGSEWISDHNVMPLYAVRLRTFLDLLFENRVINNIYIGSDRLVNMNNHVSSTAVTANKEFLSDLAERNKEIYLMVIPAARTIYTNDSDRTAALSELRTVSGVTHLDTRQYFAIQSDNPIYYRTKDAITSLGGYFAYLSSASTLGFQPLTREQFHVRYSSLSFYGELCRACGYYEVQKDVSFYNYPVDLQIEYSALVDANGAYLWNDRIFERLMWLEENGGEFWTVDLETDSTGGTLLLIADDDGSKLLPYLACHYSEITMISTDCKPQLAHNRMGRTYDSVIVAVSEDTIASEILFNESISLFSKLSTGTD